MILKRALTPNFGDDLSSVLFESITGQKPVNVNNSWKGKELNYLMIGSILSWADSNSVVWGSGFISQESQLQSYPQSIRAVRGPLTRDLLSFRGLYCPEVFGDPALLMPRFYNPTLSKQYDLSIILHHVDKIDQPAIQKRFPQAHFIDVQDNWKNIINQVIESKYIISSCLHGLIISDAYGIPNHRERVSNRLIGGDFKFNDYFESKKYLDLDKLYNVCPLRNL